MNNSLLEDIIEKLEWSLKSDTMNMINLKDPENYRKIIYITEAELYKHKRKLYPKTLNNMGHGYS
jgi:hypothetical protein